jgi:hypothetical protein
MLPSEGFLGVAADGTMAQIFGAGAVGGQRKSPTFAEALTP